MFLGVLIDKTAASMYHALVTTLGALPRSLRTSMTVDNGPENDRDLTALLGIAVCFCDPYKSWHKGAVENMNGFIRRCFPRGTDFSSIDRRGVIALQQALNNRPRLFGIPHSIRPVFRSIGCIFQITDRCCTCKVESASTPMAWRYEQCQYVPPRPIYHRCGGHPIATP